MSKLAKSIENERFLCRRQRVVVVGLLSEFFACCCYNKRCIVNRSMRSYQSYQVAIVWTWKCVEISRIDWERKVFVLAATCWMALRPFPPPCSNNSSKWWRTPWWGCSCSGICLRCCNSSCSNPRWSNPCRSNPRQWHGRPANSLQPTVLDAMHLY